MKKYVYAINNKLAYHFHKNGRFIEGDRKIVSFTFDDAPNNAFENAGNILQSYGTVGTYYISLSFLEGRPENESLYSITDLVKCISMGHELACHTFGHLSFHNERNQKVIKDDLLKNQAILNNTGIDVKLENFAYPFGEQTIRVKKIVSEIFNTCRGIEYGVNLGKVDLNNLKAVSLYQNLNPFEKISILLDDFNKTGGWLIFYTHDVQKNFSQFGCSVEYFEAVVKKCFDLGIEIKSVKQSVESLTGSWQMAGFS